MDKKKIDTIIIGSGISGMAAGIILAREGQKVLVLEQHHVPGGLTQTYSRKGAVFPTGVHRLGSLESGQPLWYYFKYLGLMDRLELVPLAKDGFEQFFFPSQSFEVPVGRDRYHQKLIEYFPDQEKEINLYFKELQRAVSNIGMYNPGNIPKKDLTLEFTMPLKAYLESIGIFGHLQSLLCANSPLYGLSSTECPLITHFAISDSYLNSSFRINEKKTPFSQALVDSLVSHGGEICLNSKVKHIQLKERTATGVVLDNGETITAEKVIFSGHPGHLTDLCPPEVFRPVFRKKLNLPNTQGLCGLALKWKQSNCPLVEKDVYIYDSWDVDYQHTSEGLTEDKLPGMVYLSALPNRELSGKPDQDIAVTALTRISDRETMILKKFYRQPDNTTYKEIKDKIGAKILDQICLAFPDAREHVQIADTYSSLTFERYTLTKNGSAYGIKKTAQQFLEAMFSPATRVRNLFLTGQSMGFNGIHGSIVSSVNLCGALVGSDYLMNKIAGVKA